MEQFHSCLLMKYWNTQKWLSLMYISSSVVYTEHYPLLYTWKWLSLMYISSSVVYNEHYSLLYTGSRTITGKESTVSLGITINSLLCCLHYIHVLVQYILYLQPTTYLYCTLGWSDIELAIRYILTSPILKNQRNLVARRKHSKVSLSTIHRDRKNIYSIFF